MHWAMEHKGTTVTARKWQHRAGADATQNTLEQAVSPLQT